MKKITIYLTIAGFLFSCSTSNEVVKNGIFQKRKYNKGWYINKSQKIDKQKGIEKQTDLAADKQVAELSVEENNNNKRSIVIKNDLVSDVNTVNNHEIAVVSFIKEKEVPTIGKKEFRSLTQNKKEVVVDQESVVISQINNDISKAEPQKIEKANKTNGDTSSSGHPMILLYILAIIIPPIAVGLVTDWETNPVIYNILWTLLCGIPGIIHAFIIIGRYK